MLRNEKIGVRLGIGFCLVFLIFALVSFITINRMGFLSGLTNMMYRHPLTVSNAVLRVDGNIVRMHRSMKDVALAKNEAEIDEASKLVDEYEAEVYKDFAIIEERFLGDKKMYEEAIQAFTDWKPIRDEVIALMQQDKKDEAAEITKGKGARHVDKLNVAMLALNNFAQFKAESFLNAALDTRTKTLQETYILVIGSILAGFLFVGFLTQSITRPLAKLMEAVIEIREGNLDKKISPESKDEIGQFSAAFNEMADKLKESYIGLRARTEELDKSNQELKEEIDQREQAEEQLNILLDDLERINTELQDFAYIVSHDLKAPLRGISSLAKWLNQDYADILDDKGRRYLGQMLDRTKRMHRLIKGVLQYSRLGRIEIKPERLETDALTRQVIATISPPENIAVRIEGTLPPVIFDKTLLHQLFQNLIKNAINHLGKPTGEVIVSGMDKGTYWEFTVRDTGVGIEARHFERIFRIFQSLKPRKETQQSAGIGLSLVKKIVERNGGTVWVESTVGQGSAFFFTIPGRVESKSIETNYTVLIIDDNVEFAKVAMKVLERAGHAALHAPGIREAYQILETHQGEIHIALIDIHLPGEEAPDRYTVMRRLRPGLKIVVTTGSDTSDATAYIKKEGGDGVLKRPFKIDEFHSIIKE